MSPSPSGRLPAVHGRFALAAGLALLGAASQADAQTVLTRHVRDAVVSGEAQVVGRMAASERLRLDVVLPLRDPAGADALAASVSDPGSPLYRHYVTPAQFTERFGPAQEDYDAAVRYLASQGLVVYGGSRESMDVEVSGSVADIERAFNLTLRLYRHPSEQRLFYAPDREPTTGLSIPLWHVSGLDDFSIPKPKLVNRDEAALARGLSPDAVVGHAMTGSGPKRSFTGSDMRAAYYGQGPLTGAGQSLGLFEFQGTDLADLDKYYANIGQTYSVPITLLSTDGSPTSCLAIDRCDDSEQNLDLTQALGMAPGLSSLVMYIGSTDTAIIGAMTSHSPLPLTIGCSWGWLPADKRVLDPYFKRMAAQGQSFFVASGDDSTWTKNGPATAWPANDAHIISVGGTDLVTTSAGGAWAYEAAWADSGGGVSPDKVAIPDWQQIAGVITPANGGSTTQRNGPDVAANANFTFYTCGDQRECQANYWGGTSFAAPMWAGFIALANQAYAAAGQGPAGFFNPTIYARNVTSAYAQGFHDIVKGTSGSYSAIKGFDLVTGWGSPKTGLIESLAP